MQRENTDNPGTSVGDLISKPVSKLRELAEAELDHVAGATAAFRGKAQDGEVGLITGDVTQTNGSGFIVPQDGGKDIFR